MHSHHTYIISYVLIHTCLGVHNAYRTCCADTLDEMIFRFYDHTDITMHKTGVLPRRTDLFKAQLGIEIHSPSRGRLEFANWILSVGRTLRTLSWSAVVRCFQAGNPPGINRNIYKAVLIHRYMFDLKPEIRSGSEQFRSRAHLFD